MSNFHRFFFYLLTFSLPLSLTVHTEVINRRFFSENAQYLKNEINMSKRALTWIKSGQEKFFASLLITVLSAFCTFLRQVRLFLMSALQWHLLPISIVTVCTYLLEIKRADEFLGTVTWKMIRNSGWKKQCLNKWCIPLTLYFILNYI